MTLPAPDLSALLHDGVELSAGTRRGRTRVHDLGTLVVPSGRLVMDDPLVDYEPPFMVPVSPGEHRVVVLVVAVSDTDSAEPADERCALAVALVDGATVADAARPGLVYEPVVPDDEEHPDELGPDDFFGYGVDSGTGCFADMDALLRDGRQERWQDDLLDELDRTARDTWSTAVMSDRGVIAFSSGWDSDGVFPSWTVRETGGRLVAVVTDFLVARDLDHSEDPVES